MILRHRLPQDICAGRFYRLPRRVSTRLALSRRKLGGNAVIICQQRQTMRCQCRSPSLPEDSKP
eukprot:12632750-Ditylum_brightwellii.AAC.1